MAVKRIIGGAIQVEADEHEVRFYAENQAVEVSMLRAAGGENGLHLVMVAGARYCTYLLRLPRRQSKH